MLRYRCLGSVELFLLGSGGFVVFLGVGRIYVGVGFLMALSFLE